jgi:hypothetical protein
VGFNVFQVALGLFVLRSAIAMRRGGVARS